MSDKAWSGRTGGTRRMQQSLIRIFRHFPPWVVYPIVWIWVCFYILFAHAGRRGIWHYWRHRLGYGRWSSAVNLYLNYLEFGKVIMDRFAAYAGRHITIRVEGQEVLDRVMNGNSGVIVLSTHIGNQELAGYSFHAPKPMYVLSYLGDTETVNDNRRRKFEEMHLHIIPMKPDGSHVLDMHNALSDGNILSVHADRLFYGSKAVYAPILGQEAAYPEGPFRIAVAEAVPVVSLFMMREGADTYTLYVRQLSDGNWEGETQREQARTLLQRYIATNEEMLRKYPRQWFHFYEFWK